MKIAILGYGKQGQSAYNHWNQPGNDITIHDKAQTEVPAGAKTKFGGDYLYDLHLYDLLIRTPALHPSEILENNINHPEVMNKITTVTNEFFSLCPAPIIGVTGTKGKGTTSSLISAFLKAAGHTVHLGGNIGTPPLELLSNNIQRKDWVVLELANYQTIDLKYSPHIAVCLMVVPEHLDWHKDMYEYVQAKEKLFKHQTPSNYSIYNARNTYSEEIADVSSAIKISYEVPPKGETILETNGAYVDGDHIFMEGYKICHIHDVKLLGRHNLENVCAAIAATWTIIGNQPELYKNVLKTFTGLPHRLEVVGIINGVTFVNDSFGTTPETAIVAVKAFKQPKVLIAGGASKQIPFDELAKVVAGSNVKHVITIGETGPRIASLVKAYDSDKKIGYSLMKEGVGMPEIIEEACKVATKGDVVLFSPASASFDMFDNYEQRGDIFRQAILARVPPAQ